MKRVLVFFVVCVAVNASADSRNLTRAESAAKAWLDAAIAKNGVLPVSKAKPLRVWIDAPSESCFGSPMPEFRGTVNTPEAVKKLRLCLQDEVNYMRSAPTIRETTVAEAMKEFPYSLVTEGDGDVEGAKASVKGTTIVEIRYLDGGQMTLLHFAVAPDRSIKALWIRGVLDMQLHEQLRK